MPDEWMPRQSLYLLLIVIEVSHVPIGNKCPLEISADSAVCQPSAQQTSKDSGQVCNDDSCIS
eukprot:scaffold617687_cov20-Prasinocladus_malaysianus.AAC.1